MFLSSSSNPSPSTSLRHPTEEFLSPGRVGCSFVGKLFPNYFFYNWKFKVLRIFHQPALLPSHDLNIYQTHFLLNNSNTITGKTVSTELSHVGSCHERHQLQWPVSSLRTKRMVEFNWGGEIAGPCLPPHDVIKIMDNYKTTFGSLSHLGRTNISWCFSK